jgi:glyoxylase-like metal-dependent hydrolase (beta-lactamase superfamily II)
MVIPDFIKILFQGFPGRATRGYLGWSSVVLIQRDKKILFDTGNWGDREELLLQLHSKGLDPRDIDAVILSHLHFDHCINLPLFAKAEVIVSEEALNYARSVKDDLFVPEWIVDYLLAIRERVRFVKGDTVLDERMTLIETPGHTPGSISCLVREGDLRVALTGDAVKNAYEFLSGAPDMSRDMEASRQTIKKISQHADIIIPGHDRAFSFDGNRIAYLSDARFEIRARSNPYSDAWTSFTIGFTDAEGGGCKIE